MSVSDFIGNWVDFSSKECSSASSCEDSNESLLYLKDWHFVEVCKICEILRIIRRNYDVWAKTFTLLKYTKKTILVLQNISYYRTIIHYTFVFLLFLVYCQEYPDYIAYTTPLFFRDDWLNLYLDSYNMHMDETSQDKNEVNCSDYRFVYMGSKGQ